MRCSLSISALPSAESGSTVAFIISLNPEYKTVGRLWELPWQWKLPRPKNDGARDRRCCLRERKEKTGEPAPLKTPSPPRLHLAPGRTFTTTRGTGPSATGKSPPRDQPPSPRAQRIASFISRMASAASLPPAALVRSQYHIPSKPKLKSENNGDGRD